MTWDDVFTEIQESSNAEELTMKALALYPDNPEGLYFLTSLFRDKGEHQKAWKYYSIWRSHPFSDAIRAEFDPLFLHEKTILNYYIGCPKEESLLDFVKYYNTGLTINYNNLEFYVYPFVSEIQELAFPDMGDFHATSTSILPYMDGYVFNIRYVNYRIQPDSSYLMMENGHLHPYHHLRTRNYMCFATRDFVIGPLHEMTPDEPPRHDKHIHGLEDIRLYRASSSSEGEAIAFIAASCEYSHDGNIQQVRGTYDIGAKALTKITPLHSPKGHSVEKNWIPNNDCYIYSWHPFVLGRIEGSDFKEVLRYDTPPFFQQMRGSTPLVTHEGSQYCIVHCIIDSRPRKYYHSVVRMVDYKIQEYTLPLYFKNNHIEYTIGMTIQDDTLITIVSQNDCNPVLVKIKLNTLKWIPIQSQPN